MNEPDWSAYSQQYDLMAEINPAYQDVLTHCIRTVGDWQLREGQVIVDICAGTGNFSIALARAFPTLTVIHAEFNTHMLELAKAKATRAGLVNWRSLHLDAELNDWPIPKITGVVAVHCIYTFKSPEEFIQSLPSKLGAQGFVYACDLGRVLNLRDWAWFMFKSSVASRGIWKSIRLVLRMSMVRKQNKAIANSQMAGTFWTHDLAQFKSTFEKAGFEILSSSSELYRGYDDLVVARKR